MYTSCHCETSAIQEHNNNSNNAETPLSNKYTPAAVTSGTDERADVVVPSIGSVLVYCSARDEIPQKYFAATRTLAETLVENGIDVVYGGGDTGLMGHLADTVVEGIEKESDTGNGVRITGISPMFFNGNHTRLTKLVRCQTMHERKTHMMAISESCFV